MVSFFALTLSCVNSGTRILLPLGKHGFVSLQATPDPLDQPHSAHRDRSVLRRPVLGVAFWHARGASVLTMFGQAGTLAAFGFLFAYYMITIAAPFYLRKLGELKPRTRRCRGRWVRVPAGAARRQLLPGTALAGQHLPGALRSLRHRGWGLAVPVEPPCPRHVGHDRTRPGGGPDRRSITSQRRRARKPRRSGDAGHPRRARDVSRPGAPRLVPAIAASGYKSSVSSDAGRVLHTQQLGRRAAVPAVDVVGDLAGEQPALAVVAGPVAAAEGDRHVARLGEVEQARVARSSQAPRGCCGENVTAGPVPGGPIRNVWRAGRRPPTIPERWTATAPNTSVAICSGVIPRAVSAAPSACMKPSGPHR